MTSEEFIANGEVLLCLGVGLCKADIEQVHELCEKLLAARRKVKALASSLEWSTSNATIAYRLLTGAIDSLTADLATAAAERDKFRDMLQHRELHIVAMAEEKAELRAVITALEGYNDVCH